MFVFVNPPDPEVADRLRATKTIAVVGLSDDVGRDSYAVAEYLASCGYTVVPINPHITMWNGRQSFPDLETAMRAARSVGKRIEMVDVFRRPSEIAAIMEEAVAKKIPAVWCQLGVTDWESAAWARDHGVWVVMDRCIAVMHRRLIGPPSSH